MESRSLLERTLKTPFPLPGVTATPADSAPLIDILEIEEDSPLQRVEAGIDVVSTIPPPPWITEPGRSPSGRAPAPISPPP